MTPEKKSVIIYAMEQAEKINKDKKEPKVTVFGKDVKEDQESGHSHLHGRKDGGDFIFGLLMVLAGIIFLFNTLGILPWSVWGIVGRLWPVILILIGVDIIFGHSWVSHVFTFILTFAAGAIILGLIFMNFSPQTLTFLPAEALNFLTVINSSLQIR